MAISTGLLPISPLMLDPALLAKRAEMQPFSCPGPIQLTQRFTTIKESLTSGRESALLSSWQKLLRDLPDEISLISSLGSQVIPTISLTDTTNSQRADRFRSDLRKRGVGIIRNVIPRDTALAWSQDTEEYLQQNSDAKSYPSKPSQPQDVYWSAAQVAARAHPNLLAAQRFVMSIWESKNSDARVHTDFPITYADRMRTRKGSPGRASINAHVDGGSVERWEPDGYGRAGTYKEIFQGNWEDYDPWESSTRLGVTSDRYPKAGACSIFRMFQGWLALNPIPSGATASGPGSIQVCPLPRHATAYFLLRPFFSPPPGLTPSQNEEWTITQPQNSILHGALPSYAQEINPSLHPHLQLDRSLVPVPQLEPGDYLVWHPDLIHAISDSNSNSDSFSSPAENNPMYMYLPACPLTQTNVLYLARQRKAFLLGVPGPDFGGGRGESGHVGRPGVQDVDDAGGDDGLRAMGLLPWDEEEAGSDREREVLAMANGILFPDLYDFL